MHRAPLVKNYDNIFKKWLKARNDSDLKAKADNLADQIRKKWAVKIYIPETTIQGLTDVWFPTALAVYVSVEDARKKTSIVLQGKEGTGFKITSASFERNHLIYCPPHKIPIIIDPNSNLSSGITHGGRSTKISGFIDRLQSMTGIAIQDTAQSFPVPWNAGAEQLYVKSPDGYVPPDLMQVDPDK
jgi:hypothetical protein